MDIGCIGIVCPDQNVVEEVDNRRVIIPVLNTDLHIFHCLRTACGSFLCCQSGRYFRVIVLNRFFQRCLFTKHDLEFHSYDLPDIFYAVEVERIIDKQPQNAVHYLISQHAVFFSHHFGNQFYGFHINRYIRYVDKFQI